MSGWIFIDKDSESGEMRSQMRRNMRGGYRGGSYPTMRGGGSYEHGYRMGYKHGWEDSEDEMGGDMDYRRQRDSRGRYV